MPELPEVETVKLGIAEHITCSTIEKIELRVKKLRKDIPIDLILKQRGSKIIEVARRAKYLMLHLDSGFSLIIHLGMSGSLVLAQSPSYEDKKHDHAVISLNNNLKLVFNDPRRFGLVDICLSDQIEWLSYITRLGVEPFSEDFNISYLKMKLAQRAISIKLALMENKILVGVGNIYASEILYASKINPLRSANNIADREVESLVFHIKDILNKAIIAGGSTLRDYKKADGTFGGFQSSFMVYNRKGEPCYQCGGLISKVTQSGRSTFFCPSCQN